MVNKFLLCVFSTGLMIFLVIVTNLQPFDKMSKQFPIFFSTSEFFKNIGGSFSVTAKNI